MSTKKSTKGNATKSAKSAKATKPSKPAKPAKAGAPATNGKAKHAKPSKAAKGDASAPIAPANEKGGKTSALARELAPLAKMGKTELWKLYEKVFGHKTASCNTTHLRSAIAKKLSEQGNAAAFEELARGEAALESTKPPRAAAAKEPRERDPRLPKVGTVLEKTHGGVVHKVKVVEDGFEYKGAKHRSLSGLAKRITGAVWNGWAWFGLTQKPVKKTAEVASAPRIARASRAPVAPTMKRAAKASGVRRG